MVLDGKSRIGGIKTRKWVVCKKVSWEGKQSNSANPAYRGRSGISTGKKVEKNVKKAE